MGDSAVDQLWRFNGYFYLEYSKTHKTKFGLFNLHLQGDIPGTIFPAELKE